MDDLCGSLPASGGRARRAGLLATEARRRGRPAIHPKVNQWTTPRHQWTASAGRQLGWGENDTRELEVPKAIPSQTSEK